MDTFFHRPKVLFYSISFSSLVLSSLHDSCSSFFFYTSFPYIWVLPLLSGKQSSCSFNQEVHISFWCLVSCIFDAFFSFILGLYSKTRLYQYNKIIFWNSHCNNIPDSWSFINAYSFSPFCRPLFFSAPSHPHPSK